MHEQARAQTADQMFRLHISQPCVGLRQLREVVAAGECAEVFWAEHTSAELEYGAVFALGFLEPAKLDQRIREVVAAGEGVRV